MPGLYETDVPMKLQELGDTIYIAESEKTPFSRLVKRGPKPKEMLSEWPCQLHADVAFTGTLDGTDISAFTHTTREKVSGYAMLLRTAGWQVTRLAQLIKAAGVKSEKAKQAADDALGLARMTEKQLLSTLDTRAESGGNTYRSRGVLSWLSDSEQGVLPVPANFRPNAACHFTAALSGFTAAAMETMLETMAAAKKGPVDLAAYVGIKLKVAMSGWAQRHVEDINTAQALTRYNLDASEKKIQRVVDFFEFDAGLVHTFAHWYLAHTEGSGASTDYSSRSGVFLDMDMWELCFLQAPTAWTVEDQGGGPRGYHDAVYILKCLNPLGQGYVYTNS
ncbi:MAG: DUF5309 family protein [Acidobacteriota bacterium]|nr:DUF5309 family protein [Acidobacteriota bacterium]